MFASVVMFICSAVVVLLFSLASGKVLPVAVAQLCFVSYLVSVCREIFARTWQM